MKDLNVHGDRLSSRLLYFSNRTDADELQSTITVVSAIVAMGTELLVDTLRFLIVRGSLVTGNVKDCVERKGKIFGHDVQTTSHYC